MRMRFMTNNRIILLKESILTGTYEVVYDKKETFDEAVEKVNLNLYFRIMLLTQVVQEIFYSILKKVRKLDSKDRKKSSLANDTCKEESFLSSIVGAVDNINEAKEH